jgi:hypothetical protein
LTQTRIGKAQTYNKTKRDERDSIDKRAHFTPATRQDLSGHPSESVDQGLNGGNTTQPSVEQVETIKRDAQHPD